MTPNTTLHIGTLQDAFAYLEEASLIIQAERAGIEISPELYRNFDSFPRVLTAQERGFLRRELKRLRRESAREWVSILAPIFSAITAILALLVALRSHK